MVKGRKVLILSTHLLFDAP